VEVSHTKKSTRIIIWIIAIVMAVGSVGAYFLVMLENDQNTQTQTAADATTQPQEEKPVDPTAFKVDGKVTELQITDIKTGDGAEVKPGDTVKVHYKGTLAKTGQKFDSSYDYGEPIELGLGQVIVGWQEGIPGMKVNGKRRLVIPAEKAYGDQPQQGIPANSDLVFEVELLGVTPAAQ
jgi:FKBP-type peptidyl-prolyl cis-trans isomerase